MKNDPTLVRPRPYLVEDHERSLWEPSEPDNAEAYEEEWTEVPMTPREGMVIGFILGAAFMSCVGIASLIWWAW